jgi:hypothetical protein
MEKKGLIISFFNCGKCRSFVPHRGSDYMVNCLVKLDFREPEDRVCCYDIEDLCYKPKTKPRTSMFDRGA